MAGVERVLRAVFGFSTSPDLEAYLETRIPCPLVMEKVLGLADFPLYGQGMEEALNKVLASLFPRERRVIELRFGLGGLGPLTLAEVGKEFGVTRNRIRQIEALALRKLRHPSRSRHLKACLYHPTALDLRLPIARWDLYGNLRRLYPEGMAYVVARQVKREDLRWAFKSVEVALRSSCGATISHCLNCGNPLPPGWTLCNRVCRKQWRILTLTCTRCGGSFLRHERLLFRSTPQGRVAHARTYCCKACFEKRDFGGPPCPTCGRGRWEKETHG